MMKPPRMGGGSMLRSVSRVISGNESLSSSSVLPPAKADGDVRPLRVPSPTFTAMAAGAAALAEWEAVGLDEGEGEEGGSGFGERWVFGRVPSSDEVQAAVLSLQQMSIHSSFYGDDENKNLEKNTEEQERVSIPRSNRSSAEISTGSESDWMEPTFHACNQLSSSSSKDRQKVLEAFRLLQTSPSVQKMVVSLSSDEAVWDAVMKNEVVQELRKSLEEGISEGKKKKKDEGPFENLAAALGRIFGTTRTKLMEFFQNISNIVNEIFHRSASEENDDERMGSFAEAVRSSLMLSVVVFLIIIVTRVAT
ncbi:hypothetical protein LUZ60_016887 [Juncus effusus]|nr:hypothetical protein LUZ60_016887 [Juncus effusus]